MKAKEGQNMSRKELVSGIRGRLAKARAVREAALAQKWEEGAEYFRSWKLNGVSEGVLRDAEKEAEMTVLNSSYTEAERVKAEFKVRLLKAIRGTSSKDRVSAQAELYRYHVNFCEAMGSQMAEEAETTMFYVGAMEAALKDREGPSAPLPTLTESEHAEKVASLGKAEARAYRIIRSWESLPLERRTPYHLSSELKVGRPKADLLVEKLIEKGLIKKSPLLYKGANYEMLVPLGTVPDPEPVVSPEPEFAPPPPNLPEGEHYTLKTVSLKDLCEAAEKAPEPLKETPVKIFKSKDTADFVARAINDWAELHGVEAQVSVWSCSRPDGGKFYTISSRDDAFQRPEKTHVLLNDGTFVED